jgi:cell division septum initiation protein DivIVA
MTGEPRRPGEAPPSTIDLLDALDTLLNEAHRVPFSASVMVNDQDVLQLVDRIRLSLPQDVVRAQRILDERERVLTDTEERAREIAERAEAAAQELRERVEGQARELIQRARTEAAALGARAEADAARTVAEAQAHAERLVSEHVVVRLAEERAAVLIREAEERAQSVSADAERYARDADDYVRAVMGELEGQLVAATETVRKGLGTLAGRSPSPSPAAGRGRRGGRRA